MVPPISTGPILSFRNFSSFFFYIIHPSEAKQLYTKTTNLTHIFPDQKFSASSALSSLKMNMKTTKSKEESVKGLMMLKLLVRKLQRAILHSSFKEPSLARIDEEIKMVPKDVKQGHFAVIAIKGKEPQRFILELDYLANPAFMKLLEQAEDEFGFHQKGVLTVPCQPEELQTILNNRKNRRMSTEW